MRVCSKPVELSTTRQHLTTACRLHHRTASPTCSNNLAAAPALCSPAAAHTRTRTPVTADVRKMGARLSLVMLRAAMMTSSGPRTRYGFLRTPGFFRMDARLYTKRTQQQAAATHNTCDNAHHTFRNVEAGAVVYPPAKQGLLQLPCSSTAAVPTAGLCAVLCADWLAFALLH